MDDNFWKRRKSLASEIEKCYESFGTLIHIPRGMYISDLKRFIFEIEIMPGTKAQNVYSCASDVQMALNLPVFYPYPDGIAIRLVVSEVDIKENRLLKILAGSEFLGSKMKIPLAIGYDPMGKEYIEDLAELQHLIVTGPSGTGKSVALQCIVLSIITRCSIKDVRLIMYDIGANSLELFEEVRHLYTPIVKDVENGCAVLRALVNEMDKRVDIGERECKKLPFLVCIIDEFDDTIASIEDQKMAKKFVNYLNSIIRRGRKAKVILILASHDAKEEKGKVNINGIIPRIAFQCANHHKSSTALGVTGAENLPKDGALLFKSRGGLTPIRLQGSYITESEIREILGNLTADYEDIDMLEIEQSNRMSDVLINNVITDESNQKELAEIIFWILQFFTCSAEGIKREFKMGNRVKKIIKILEQMNIVGELKGNSPREVLPQSVDDIPKEVQEFMEKNGFSIKEIAERISGRSITTLFPNGIK